MENLSVVKSFILKHSCEERRSLLIVGILSVLSVFVNLCLPLLTKRIVDDGLVNKSIKSVIIWSTYFSVFFVFQIVLDYCREKRRIRLCLSIKQSVLKRVVEKIWETKYDFFYEKKSAEVICNLDYDAEMVASLYDSETIFGITQIFNLLGGLIGLSIINWKMMLGIFVVFPIKLYLVRKFALINKENVENYMGVMEETAQFEEDSFDGIKDIKIYGLKDIFSKMHDKILDRLFESEERVNVLTLINSSLDKIIAQVCVLYIYILGACFLLYGEMSIGSIVAFVTYSSYVLSPIAVIFNIYYKLTGIVPSINRVNEILTKESENESGNLIQIGSNLKLIFNNVGFGYEKNDWIFQGLTQVIDENNITVIAGGNGKGKTTLLNLIMRLLEPKDGQIILGNTDIRQISLKNYRSIIAYVSQTPFLFHDSLRNNLTAFKNIADEEILEMCKKIGLEDLVDKVGLEYDVGNQGSKLSGGQKQKIAIARAILSGRKFLILDEATSNLDKRSKKQLMEVLQSIKKKRNIILVTHDEDIIAKSDDLIMIGQ